MKYEFTGEVKICFGRTLHQIRAKISFGNIAKGDIGGWIESEKNLSQGGDAWVSGNARVFGDAWVSGNAWVFGDACVSGNARVFGDAWVSGNARVSGDAWVSGNARVSGDACVFGDAWVFGDACVSGNASIMWISNIGSRSDTTTFFLDKNKEIIVNCGCFHGTIEQFREAVEKEHGDNLHGKMYRLAIEMAKMKLQSATNEPPEEGEADE